MWTKAPTGRSWSRTAGAVRPLAGDEHARAHLDDDPDADGDLEDATLRAGFAAAAAGLAALSWFVRVGL